MLPTCIWARYAAAECGHEKHFARDQHIWSRDRDSDGEIPKPEKAAEREKREQPFVSIARLHKLRNRLCPRPEEHSKGAEGNDGNDEVHKLHNVNFMGCRWSKHKEGNRDERRICRIPVGICQCGKISAARFRCDVQVAQAVGDDVISRRPYHDRRNANADQPPAADGREESQKNTENANKSLQCSQTKFKPACIIAKHRSRAPA